MATSKKRRKTLTGRRDLQISHAKQGYLSQLLLNSRARPLRNAGTGRSASCRTHASCLMCLRPLLRATAKNSQKGPRTTRLTSAPTPSTTTTRLAMHRMPTLTRCRRLAARASDSPVQTAAELRSTDVANQKFKSRTRLPNSENCLPN